MENNDKEVDTKVQLKNLKTEFKKRRKSNRQNYKENKKLINNEFDNELEIFYKTTGLKEPQNPPKRSVLEEIGNSVTHGIGSIFAIVAFVLMCVHAENAREYVGATMYFVGLFIMFTMSCLYHSFKYGTRVKRLFRRFDYSCIYLLIGATFAPILLCYSEGNFGIIFLVIQWVIIVTGISLVGVFGPTKLRFIHIPLYLILGWCGLMFLPKMVQNGDYLFLGTTLGGGVIYSIGVIPFALKKKAAHFIWHFFVLAGAVVHWVGIYMCIYLNI